MKSPKDIVASHQQTHRASCVPWAIEVVILTFEKVLRESLQAKFPLWCGFGDFREILRNEYQIEFDDPRFSENFDRFKRESMAVLSEGKFPIVMLPSGACWSRDRLRIVPTLHAYAVYEEAGALHFATRGLGDFEASFYSEKEFAEMHHNWRLHFERVGWAYDCALHALFPRLARE